MKFTQMKSTIFQTMIPVFWFLLGPSNLNFLRCYVVHSWDIGVPPSGMAPRQSTHNVMLHSAQWCLSPLFAHYPQLFVGPFTGKCVFPTTTSMTPADLLRELYFPSKLLMSWSLNLSCVVQAWLGQNCLKIKAFTAVVSMKRMAR